jgi:hypothetical protein
VEEYEMQFNYIYMDEIQGYKKIQFSKIMKDCTDIHLFEQEAIQHIIDYKWDTFGYQFFSNRAILYSVFMILYYIDLEMIHVDPATIDNTRVNLVVKIVCKTICSMI